MKTTKCVFCELGVNGEGPVIVTMSKPNPSEKLAFCTDICLFRYFLKKLTKEKEGQAN